VTVKLVIAMAIGVATGVATQTIIHYWPVSVLAWVATTLTTLKELNK